MTASVRTIYGDQTGIWTRRILALPCNVHPSYPYGDPTSLGHPAARPRTQGDPTSRALFEDVVVYGVEPFSGTLRWHELALDQLLPVDEQKAEAERAAQARTVAPGISPSHAHGSADEEEDEEDADDSTEQVEEEEE